MIDNFDQIAELLKFENEGDFYFLQIIQRKKDHPKGHVLGTNNNNRLIKSYYVYSLEQFFDKKNEIVTLCDVFNARAGINLNRRNNRDIALEMLSLLAKNIKNGHLKQLSKLYDTVCGQYHSDKDKTWIVDLDADDMGDKPFIESAIKCVEPNREVRTEIPSKNGCHLITHPFNTQKFALIYPDIEIHKNNPTNLYIP